MGLGVKSADYNILEDEISHELGTISLTGAGAGETQAGLT